MDYDDEKEKGAESEFKGEEESEDVGEGMVEGAEGGEDGGRGDEGGGGGVVRTNWGERGERKTGEWGGGEFDKKERFSPTVGEKRQVGES